MNSPPGLDKWLSLSGFFRRSARRDLGQNVISDQRVGRGTLVVPTLRRDEQRYVVQFEGPASQAVCLGELDLNGSQNRPCAETRE